MYLPCGLTTRRHRNRTALSGVVLILAAVVPPPAVGQDAPSSQPSATQPAATTGPATTQPAPTSAPATTLQAAAEQWVQGEYEQASEQYRALLSDPQTAVEAAVGLARCALLTGSYAEGLGDLDALAEQGESVPAWHTVRAELLVRLGSHGEAIRHLRRALELDAQHHRARYLLGHWLELTGRRDEAIETYSFFDRLFLHRMPTTADGLTEAAKGFYRYSVLTRHPELSRRTIHVLQEYLQAAYERLDRNWWPARIAAADLLRSKGNLEQAGEDYQGALRINSRLPDAHVGLGLIALEGWQFEEVERRVEAALAVDPNCAAAHNLAARSKILERRYDEAVEACERVLEVNPRDIEALSLAAAACRCKYDPGGAQRYRDRVLEINPRSALLYQILGDALSGLRQYADSEAAYLEAIEYDPTDSNPQTELGMMYMQWGREDRAREVLDKSWKLDEFNTRTNNTIHLLERIKGFKRAETEHFTVLYDEELDWPIEPYVVAVLEEIYGDICADYETNLLQKAIIEIFPTHRDFGVRITGKPWIHTVGACTGWVIALDSPRPHPQTMGPYHYARVLRHEFIHTVTLALTHNRIAHWFTEGLAVSGEDAPRGLAWRELLADAIRRDRLFSLESVDWGFIRPQRPTDRQMAYAQSEWMVEYIVHRYGYDALGRMLRAFASGKPQAEVFREALGVETQVFDAEFAAWARQQAEPWGFDLTPPENVVELRAEAADDPENAAVLGRLAKAEFDDGNLEHALEAARKTLDLDERELNALTVFVSVLAKLSEEARTPEERSKLDDEMLPPLHRLAEVAPEDWTAPGLLADIVLRRQEYDEAVPWLERLKRVCPLSPASYRGLAGIYLRRGQAEAALPELLELARLDEHDPQVPGNIAAIMAGQDRLGEARYWYMQSIYIDPYEPKTHRKLAETLMRTGETEAAVNEYEMLCRMEPGQAQNFADVAFAYHKLGDGENARRRAEKAVELDPTSPAGALLDEDAQ
ncbi:MAG TPA: tetratricopeptide repeat protein [Phycisphaerae bacterium]|nr:tetratricopeptide repeat protein [Phycisphaerae bacterium]